MRRFWLIWLAFFCLLLAGGCGYRQGMQEPHRTEDGRIIVRVSMINSSSYPQWRAYVENHCPGAVIQWENNRNMMTNVLYQANHKDMPDIIAIRRFESDTAVQLQPYLADLASLAITASFKPQYLEPFAADGRQYWLPAPGVLDGIVANLDVFQRCGVAVPRNRAEFIRVCQVMRQQDIVPLAMDLKGAWTPIQMFEGFSLSEPSARDWWAALGRGKKDALDEAVFHDLAGIMIQLREQGILRREDIQSDAAVVDNLLGNGRAAMGRKASDEVFNNADGEHYAALPFFGEREEDSWLYTYPAFSLAMSKDMAEDGERREAGQQVLEVMLSPEAQAVLNQSGMGLISYNKDIQLPLSPAMRYVEPWIEKNHCFIRVLNAQSFEAASLAMTALLQENADEELCREIFGRQLFLQPEPVEIGVSNLMADNRLDAVLCSPAASVIAQILWQQTGSDFSIIDVRDALSPIYKGRYMDTDIGAVVAGCKIYGGTLRGSELKQLLDSTILYATTFQRGNIEPLIEYPALAGGVLTMQRDGRILQLQSEQGTPVEEEQEYQVTVSSSVYRALTVQRNRAAACFHPLDGNLRQCFTAYFQERGALPQPTAYFIVQDGDGKL